jgi:hypothetical protein
MRIPVRDFARVRLTAEIRDDEKAAAMPVLRRFPLLKGMVAFWAMVGAGLILHGLVLRFAWTHFLLFPPLAAPITLGLTGQNGRAVRRPADRRRRARR